MVLCVIPQPFQSPTKFSKMLMLPKTTVLRTVWMHLQPAMEYAKCERDLKAETQVKNHWSKKHFR